MILKKCHGAGIEYMSFPAAAFSSSLRRRPSISKNRTFSSASDSHNNSYSPSLGSLESGPAPLLPLPWLSFLFLAHSWNREQAQATLNPPVHNRAASFLLLGYSAW